jgi:hypothetical protein
MFAKFFTKLSSLADHHQLMVAGLITFSFICISWGTEKLLETYLYPNNPQLGYIFAVLFGISLLWVIKHYTLKEW